MLVQPDRMTDPDPTAPTAAAVIAPPPGASVDPTGWWGPFDPSDAPEGDAHDFDFLHGEWDIANRRLRARGVGSDDWEAFPAHSRVEPRLDGAANIDEAVFPTLGFAGLTLRSFDRGRRQWSITWINSTSGALDPPVLGGFGPGGERGLFYGEDVDGAVPVRVVFVWTRLGADRARWEQGCSTDGIAWERNWVMDFTRRPAPPGAGAGTTSGAPR